MAMTGSPTRSASDSPSWAGLRSSTPSIRMMAMSLAGSLPTSVASCSAPSDRRTVMPSDWEMTWALVMIRPSADRTMPLPAPREHAALGGDVGLDRDDRLLDLVEDRLDVHDALGRRHRRPSDDALGVAVVVVDHGGDAERDECPRDGGDQRHQPQAASADEAARRRGARREADAGAALGPPGRGGAGGHPVGGPPNVPWAGAAGGTRPTGGPVPGAGTGPARSGGGGGGGGGWAPAAAIWSVSSSPWGCSRGASAEFTDPCIPDASRHATARTHREVRESARRGRGYPPCRPQFSQATLRWDG